MLDGVFLDSMDNDFNTLTGSWPEAYFYADSEGICKWKSMVSMSGCEDMEAIQEIVIEQGWVQKPKGSNCAIF